MEASRRFTPQPLDGQAGARLSPFSHPQSPLQGLIPRRPRWTLSPHRSSKGTPTLTSGHVSSSSSAEHSSEKAGAPRTPTQGQHPLPAVLPGSSRPRALRPSQRRRWGESGPANRRREAEAQDHISGRGSSAAEVPVLSLLRLCSPSAASDLKRSVGHSCKQPNPWQEAGHRLPFSQSKAASAWP